MCNPRGWELAFLIHYKALLNEMGILANSFYSEGTEKKTPRKTKYSRMMLFNCYF